MCNSVSLAGILMVTSLMAFPVQPDLLMSQHLECQEFSSGIQHTHTHTRRERENNSALHTYTSLWEDVFLTGIFLTDSTTSSVKMY